jgi:hypothetical protein
MLTEKAGHASMMGTLGVSVLKGVPRHVELLPAGDRAAVKEGARHAPGPTPDRVAPAVSGNRDTDHQDRASRSPAHV